MGGGWRSDRKPGVDRSRRKRSQRRMWVASRSQKSKETGSPQGILEGNDSQFSSVQLLSRVQFFVTPWTAARQASLSITNSQSLLKLMCIESVMPSNHLILLPSIFPSIRVFSNESALRIRWPKDWSFSFSISPSKDWLDLLVVQGTLKSLLQHHSSKFFSSHLSL